MRRNFALIGTANDTLCSVACLGFVVVLTSAFWAGAIWLGELLMRAGAQPF